MHPNLEKRFIELEVARTTLEIKRLAFANRFRVLFENLAIDMSIGHAELANRLGWNPYPHGGNAVSLGIADPSPEDCYRLMEIYLSHADTLPKSDRCDICGWPLKATAQEGCTAGNCSQRPVPK